jgi:hypothetical protein
LSSHFPLPTWYHTRVPFSPSPLLPGTLAATTLLSARAPRLTAPAPPSTSVRAFLSALLHRRVDLELLLWAAAWLHRASASTRRACSHASSRWLRSVASRLLRSVVPHPDGSRGPAPTPSYRNRGGRRIWRSCLAPASILQIHPDRSPVRPLDCRSGPYPLVQHLNPYLTAAQRLDPVKLQPTQI